jgi:hypothetical protein
VDEIDDRARVEVRLPRELIAWLDRLAQSERRDRGAQIEVLLRQARSAREIARALEGE